jgi:hypothetical protein
MALMVLGNIIVFVCILRSVGKHARDSLLGAAILFFLLLVPDRERDRERQRETETEGERDFERD